MSRSASNCPDNNFYGRFRLDMNTRLNLSSTGLTRQPESVL